MPASRAQRAQRLQYQSKKCPAEAVRAKLNYNEFTPMTKGPVKG